MRALGEALRSDGYDLIAVQNVLDEDAEFLAHEAILSRLQRDVAIDGKLEFLARWPLDHKEQKVFTVRPSARRVAQGEWRANKGVLCTAQLRTPAGPLDVYDTHTVADYPDAKYKTIRMTQLFELAKEIELRSDGRPFVLLGDFNVGPSKGGYALVQDLLDLEDPCVDCRRRSLGPPWTTAAAWTRSSCRGAARRSVKARRAMDGQREGLVLSDHAAVEATVDLRLMKLKPRRGRARRVAALKTLETALDNMSAGMVARQRPPRWIPVYGSLMSLRYSHELTS